jgi:uncharacterized RDD family membrane protein YckC
MAAVTASAGLATTDYPLSGWWRRVFARLIDALIAVGGFAVVLETSTAIRATSGVAIAALMLGFAWFVLYFVVGHASKSGQTLGKKALGIAVKGDVAHARIGYGRAFARFSTDIFLALIPLVGFLDALMPLWDRDNQALHDKVVNTVVVRVP